MTISRCLPPDDLSLASSADLLLVEEVKTTIRGEKEMNERNRKIAEGTTSGGKEMNERNKELNTTFLI